jgi:hypothetical protein
MVGEKLKRRLDPGRCQNKLVRIAEWPIDHVLNTHVQFMGQVK